MSQQTELDEALVPLERAAEELPPGHQHADREREGIFQMTVSLDSELQQMMRDIKEVIDHVNQDNLIDNQRETNDGLSQITKILNAHVETLQWIDQNTRKLKLWIILYNAFSSSCSTTLCLCRSPSKKN